MELTQRTIGHANHARQLTAGQRLTLLLTACGYTPTEIADELGIGVGGVVAELSRVVDRLGAATVREAIAIAAGQGLFTRSAAVPIGISTAD